MLLGILPRQNDWFCGRIARINSLIKDADNGKTVRYLDMKDQFLAGPGKVKAELYNGDQLHLVAAGYEVWHKTMQSLFDEMVK